MTAPTGNTAPLDHILPDDPSAWTALDHAVAIANLRGAIIARERAALNYWRCEALSLHPTCGTDHSYWAWEQRDSIGGVIRENAALRERVARLRRYVEYMEYEDWTPDTIAMNRETYLQSGDLDGAGEGEG